MTRAKSDSGAGSSSQEPLFTDCYFTFTSAAAKADDHAEIRQSILDEGGQFVSRVTKKLTHLIATSDDVSATKVSAMIRDARKRDDVEIVPSKFVQECIKEGKLLRPYAWDPSNATKKRDRSPSPSGSDAPNKVQKTQQKATDSDDDDDTAKSASSASLDTSTNVPVKQASPVKKEAPRKVKQKRVPVDSKLANFSLYNVYVDGDDVYDALLNQTDIRNNNNKFYIIQLLNSSNNYFVWTRWGRVGADGQSNLDSFSSVDDAVKSFCKKFTDKTRNRWENRDSFEKIPGKYFLLERDTGDESDDETESTVAAAPEKMAKVPDSTLPPSVQSLMNLIFNMDMMTRTMVEIGFDAKKMPLGKLSKTTIEKAYKVLARISQQIDQSNPLTLMDMSSEFYTIIPHDFGRRKPPVIDTPHALKNKLEMLQALGDIEIASQLLATTAAQCTQNPVDLHYKSLKAAISPIDAKSAEFQLVNTYLQTTHAETHGQFSLSLEDLYEVERSEETDRFKKIHNRQLLWHGSLLTNFVGILSQGLRIAPPEAPVSGYMFGKGIYFADMASKSANYCRVNRGVGILLLCEVALGHTLKLHQADYDGPVSCKKANCHSVHGKGRSAPDPSQHVKHPADPDLLVPCGKASKSADPNCALLYNEFIVYDVAQVKIRYLLKVRFN